MRYSEESDSDINKAFKALRYEDYEDPVAKSEREFNAARKNWIGHIHEVAQGRGGETQAEADAGLVRLTDDYVKRFESVSSTFADNLFDERAIEALTPLIEFDAHERLEYLSKLGYGRLNLKSPAEYYLKDMVIAFADPGQNTIAVQQEEPVTISREGAVDIFADILEWQKDCVLGRKIPNKAERERARRNGRNKKLGIALGAMVGFSIFKNVLKRK